VKPIALARRTALITLVALTATVPVALVGPAASAATTNTVRGGCFDRWASTNAVRVGVIGDVSVTTTSGQPPAPIGATVTCWIDLNGSPMPGTTHSYGDLGPAGLQAGADTVSVDVGSDDVLSLCQSVAFADGSSTSSCEAETVTDIPPDWILEKVWELLTWGGGPCGGETIWPCIDPVACSVFASLAGSYPGGVTIQPDGDIEIPDPLNLGLSPLYDCPPYRVY
jgi:hypothetical protein